MVVSEAVLVVEKKFAFGRWRSWMVKERGLFGMGSMG